MCIRKEDLKPGAYVHDTQTRALYEVQTQINNIVRLMDARSPVDNPQVRSLTMSAPNLKRLELIRHARNLEELASIEEFGPLG